jgi:hypothetical protein
MKATSEHAELRRRIGRDATTEDLDGAVAAVAAGLDEEGRSALWLYGWHHTRDPGAAARLERAGELSGAGGGPARSGGG